MVCLLAHIPHRLTADASRDICASLRSIPKLSAACYAQHACARALHRWHCWQLLTSKLPDGAHWACLEHLMCCTGLALCQEQHTRQGNQSLQFLILRSLLRSQAVTRTRTPTLFARTPMYYLVRICVRSDSGFLSGGLFCLVGLPVIPYGCRAACCLSVCLCVCATRCV